MKKPARKSVSLYEAVAKLRSPSEAQALLEILLSDHETKNLEHRWSAFLLLLDGETQRTVKEDLGISIATASRAARAIAGKSEIVKRLLSRIQTKSD